MKHYLRSKTLWVSLATILTGIGMYVSGEQDLQAVLVSVIGAVFAVLRVVTKEPISFDR